MKMENKIIGLITDFGTADGYPAAMKGRIYSLLPGATVVDISHEIQPFNIREAAFCLFNSYTYFPAGTIFVVVVDPGVGTRRPGVVLQTSQFIFIGPDNGVFSLVLQHESFHAQRILPNRFPWEIAETFHGRDVFAPLAALIASGEDVQKYLAPHSSLTTFYTPPRKIAPDQYAVQVLHIDHFGNVILNFHRSRLPESARSENVKLQLPSRQLKGIRKTFGEVPAGELLLCWDSSGHLQIAKNQGNAAQELNLKIDQEMILNI